MSSPAPLLSDDLVRQAQAIAAAIRDGAVAPLVGGGLSIPRGLPSWAALIDRLILAWREWDDSTAKRRLTPASYIRLMRRQFPSDLAIASYLRHRIRTVPGLSFGQLLYSALYTPAGAPFTPEPSDVHRHLVRLFARQPARLWTTNYDDLLEEAARSQGLTAVTLDPSRRRIRPGLAVAHLHGFLAPPARAAGHPEPREAETILTLAEDDFHVIAGDVVGWTNREFHRLFDEHRVLILGMSLDDPNVRRVLATRPPRPNDPPRHAALMRRLAVGPDDLPRTRPRTRMVCADDVNAFRAWYWRQYGVEVVALPDHDTILPFLVRLRYESEGERPGDLWRAGAARGWAAIQPWEPEQQRVGRLLLREAIEGLERDFALPAGEVVEMGIFLLQPDGGNLELTFRAGRSKQARPGEVTFSADPGRPTGVAGRVFVSGAGVRVGRTDALHDYGLAAGARRPSGSYAGIISVPLVDWEADGVPVGVVYITTATTDGAFFRLPIHAVSPPAGPTLDDLYAWLHLSALSMLGVVRKMGGRTRDLL